MRLRNNKKAGPFPEPEDDTEMPFFEAQLNAAHADPEDQFLEVLFSLLMHSMFLRANLWRDTLSALSLSTQLFGGCVPVAV